MESWRRVWREGFTPLISTKALKALAHALEIDDTRLIQGATTVPPPLQCVQDWSVESACAIGFCGAADLDWPECDVTVADTEEYFAKSCYGCDQNIGEPAACRFFLNWFDETPREEVFKELLPEVQLAIAQKEISNGI